MPRTAAILALCFSAFLTLAELARNWGAWQYWPFWLVDFIAAALLAAGGVRVLQRRMRSGKLLSGAWGFTTAMFYMSFWSHIAELDQPADGNFEQRPLTIAIGVLWAITIAGFVLSLLGARAHEKKPGETAERRG